MSQLLPDRAGATCGYEASSEVNGEYGLVASKILSATEARTAGYHPPIDAPTDELFYNHDFTKARDRCARAVFAYNNEYLEAAKARRTELWLDIVDPARVRLNLPGEHLAPPGPEVGPDSQDCPPQAAQVALVPDVKPRIRMDYGLRVRIDPKTFINTDCVIVDTPVADVTIGAGTSIGPRVCIYSVGHSLAQDANGIRSIFGKPVTIEGGCWIGGGTIIMPGVTIGAHSTIGAGSIVTRSIPAGVLAYGQPARVVRSLNSVADGPPAAFASAQAMTFSEALQLGVDEARRDQVRREVEILKLEDEIPLPRS